MIDFVEFPKIARLSRACTITEKIDGTNAQIHIRLECDPETGAVRECLEFGVDTQVTVDGRVAYIRAGSRSRWLSHSKTGDNHGFGQWVYQHAHELAALGVGSHFGEWWGSGIQRGYGLTEKRFSLFNTHRWSDDAVRPACCYVVPTLFSGEFSTSPAWQSVDELRRGGSRASPGFMNPEGVIVWHEAARIYFKKTLHRDDEWKGREAS